MAVSGSIKQIQQALNKLGYRGMTGSPIQENGVWTPDTQYAFAKYQTQEGRNKAKSVSNFSSSLQVASLQELLNRAGYTDMNGNRLAVDGVMGEKTQYALNQFKQGKATAESKLKAPEVKTAPQAQTPVEEIQGVAAGAEQEDKESGLMFGFKPPWRIKDRVKDIAQDIAKGLKYNPSVMQPPEEESDEDIYRGIRDSAQRVVFPQRQEQDKPHNTENQGKSNGRGFGGGGGRSFGGGYGDARHHDLNVGESNAPWPEQKAGTSQEVSSEDRFGKEEQRSFGSGGGQGFGGGYALDDRAVSGAAEDVARNAGVTTNNLITSATALGRGGVSPVGRAFQKHAGNPNRAGAFTGEISGNATQNTQNGTNYLKDILSNQNSTYTIRNTKAFGDVLDVRLPDGTGARWSADGKIFIGLLEKYTK